MKGVINIPGRYERFHFRTLTQTINATVLPLKKKDLSLMQTKFSPFSDIVRPEIPPNSVVLCVKIEFLF